MELPTRTILIVDDTPEDRVLFRRVLTRNSAYSYRFIETETGREALSLCGVDNLDCILLDYELPDMYGTEILKGIVAQRGANPIPVVMLSGRASLQIAVKALQHGAHDYLDKDHQRDGDDLHRAISNAIEKVRLERERRHAIEQLRESEAQMRLVLNASKVGIWIYDFATRRTNWSPEAYDIFGRTYYGGTNEEFDRMLHPEDVEFARKIFNTAVKSHRLYQAEFRILRPDGEIRWVGNQGHAEYQADGKPRRFLGTVYDITARKRHELSLAFTAEISHDLMQSRKIDEVIQRVGAKIGHYLGLSVCTFMEIDETADQAVVMHEWHQADALSLDGTYQISKFVTGEFYRASRAGETFVCHDTQTDPRTDAKGYAAIQVGAYVSVPLIQNGIWRFLFVMFDSKPRHWRRDEIELIQELTTRIWTRLERVRVDEALRASEEKLRAIFDGTHEYIGLLSPDGILLEANRASLEFAGQAREEEVGKPFWETVWFRYTPGTPELVRNAIGRAAAGEFVLLESVIFNPAREKLVFEITFEPIRNQTGEVILIVPEGRNITERKQAELDAQFLANLGQYFASFIAPAELITAVTQATGQHFYASRCILSEVDMTRGVVIAGNDYHPPHLQSVKGEYRLSDVTPEDVIDFAAGRAVVKNDLGAHPNTAQVYATVYGPLGIGAALTVPYMREGRCVALMTVACQEPYMWTQANIALLRTVLERTWLAIENTRLQAETLSLNATLEQRVDERTTELRDSQAQLRKLAAYAERTLENERTRIAREAHDQLGGGLTLLKLMLARTAQGRESDSDLFANVQDMRGQVTELIQTVRRIASDLRPALLDNFGLGAAIEWHLQEWEKRTGIVCDLTLPLENIELDIAPRTAIFRVFQELLTNVARHAQANQVTVNMQAVDQQLVLTVNDDGVGISAEALKAGQSLGLLGMRERMREVGGELELRGTPGQGTTATIRITLA